MDHDCHIPETFVYRIDRDDKITHVSDNWNRFARENKSCESSASPEILGKSIWSFISDAETQHLYQMLAKRVRTEKIEVTVPICCDSPELRRFMEVSISSCGEECLEFRSVILATEQRAPVALLDSEIERSDKLIRICSYCKKIALSDGTWINTEHAIAALGLFEQEKLPQLTHGICPACHGVLMEELKKMRK